MTSEPENGSLKPAETLDARGLKCPLPVLKAKKAMRPLAGGAILEVLATDPSAPADFESFCQVTGNDLVVSEVVGEEKGREIQGGEVKGDVYRMLIRKA